MEELESIVAGRWHNGNLHIIRIMDTGKKTASKDVVESYIIEPAGMVSGKVTKGSLFLYGVVCTRLTEEAFYVNIPFGIQMIPADGKFHPLERRFFDEFVEKYNAAHKAPYPFIFRPFQ